MSEKTEQFTGDELLFLYSLIKESRTEIQEILSQMESNDPERDFVLDSQKIANSCYRKLKKIVSDMP